MEKKKTFLWQIILLIAAVWNCWDTWNVPVSPNRKGLKGRGQVRWLDVYNNAISDVTVFFGHLHICSLWFLIRPGSRIPNANTSLLRAGVWIWPEENVASQSHLKYKHTCKCNYNVEQISLEGEFLHLCCSLNNHRVNTLRSFQLSWNQLRGQVMNLIVTLVSMSAK